eukprot:2067664-Karenia_brevis.AAC.1
MRTYSIPAVSVDHAGDSLKSTGHARSDFSDAEMEKLGEEVDLLPTHTTSNPCSGKASTVEIHHQRVELANPGDNGVGFGLHIK